VISGELFAKEKEGMPRRVVSAGLRAVARELRSKQTPAEQRMWRLLRDRRLRSLKIRRQFPIGSFVADFCCFELKLVVELDGEVHAEPRQVAHDENRDIYLRSQGYMVLRFVNQRVFKDPAGVLQEIVEAAWQRGWVDVPSLLD
jgi:very-short-patch-repair endonuclease